VKEISDIGLMNRNEGRGVGFILTRRVHHHLIALWCARKIMFKEHISDFEDEKHSTLRLLH